MRKIEILLKKLKKYSILTREDTLHIKVILEKSLITTFKEILKLVDQMKNGLLMLQNLI